MKPRRVENRAREASGSLPGQNVDLEASRDASWSASGRQKNFGCAQERLREISGSIFSVPRVPRGSPRGSLRASGRVF